MINALLYANLHRSNIQGTQWQRSEKTDDQSPEKYVDDFFHWAKIFDIPIYYLEKREPVSPVLQCVAAIN